MIPGSRLGQLSRVMVAALCSWIIGAATSGCDSSERDFCVRDSECLACERCEAGICVLDESKLNPCGTCGPTPEEQCGDMLDDDCDGETDEGCPCTSGDTLRCGTDEGVCEFGQQICAEGVWGSCQGGQGPLVESCNHADDDCDGETDEGLGLGEPCDGPDADLCPEGETTCEGCSDLTGDNQEPCDGEDNDCDGATDEECACVEGETRMCGTDMGACEPGRQTCTNSLWGTCEGGVDPVEETCNGLDDDCDGRVDEGFGLREPCDGPDADQCQEGETTCEGCSDTTGDTLEVCDGKDNDCDGTIDEACDCTDGQSRTCGSDIGACTFGTQACQEGAWGPCEGSVEPAPETCNGVDDDCDGGTDEGYGLGAACDGPDADQCPEGEMTCAGCSDTTGDTAETCDGTDDDCDGMTDEGCACQDGATRTCGTDEGVCAPGTQACTEGAWGPCEGSIEPVDEACNGLDDDCDGETDEDFDLGSPCDGPDSDHCPEGEMSCAGCSDESGDDIEICNGLDDDCDDYSDEGGHDVLCRPLPPHVLAGTCTHTSWGCTVMDPSTDCQAGWWDFNAEWEDGCELQLDLGGDSCGEATQLPAVSDRPPGEETLVNGTLYPPGDEDWYQVVGVDTIEDDEGADQCDDYRVEVSFVEVPDGVVFDVLVDACDAPGCLQEQIFDFGTDFWDGAEGLGQCPCSNSLYSTYNHCTAEDHTFYIRVHRLDVADADDTPYVLRIANAMGQ